MNEQWRVTSIGDVASINPEKTPSWADDESIRYVDIASVSAEQGINVPSIEAIRWDEAPGRARRRIREGDVLVSTVRPNLRAFTIVPAELDGEVASTGFAVLRASDEVLPGFLWALVRSEEFVAAMVARCTGSNYPAIRASDVGEYEFALPPFPVQGRIVDLMEHLDNQVNRLRAEADAASETRSSLRRQLRSDATAPLRTLAGDGGIQIGPFGSQLHAHEYTPEGTPVVMPQDLVDGVISSAKIKRVPVDVANRLGRHRLQPGDIVFPRRGDLSKRAMITNEQKDWLCGTGCIRFRPADSGMSTLLYQGLADQSVTDWLTENAVGTTMLNLNTTIVGNLPVPEMTGEAEAIAHAAARADDLVRALANEVRTLRGLRSRLLAALLTGQAVIPPEYNGLLGVAS